MSCSQFVGLPPFRACPVLNGVALLKLSAHFTTAYAHFKVAMLCWFGALQYALGELSPYGDEALPLLQSIAARGELDPEGFSKVTHPAHRAPSLCPILISVLCF